MLPRSVNVALWWSVASVLYALCVKTWQRKTGSGRGEEGDESTEMNGQGHVCKAVRIRERFVKENIRT